MSPVLELCEFARLIGRQGAPTEAPPAAEPNLWVDGVPGRRHGKRGGRKRGAYERRAPMTVEVLAR